MGRNDIRLWTNLDGKLVSHFRLVEFENRDGLCMIDPRLLLGLEQLRQDLCEKYFKEISIKITCALRTHKDNENLAAKLGWTDEGGSVSRTSKHLPEYGGIAADIYAYDEQRQNLPSITVGAIAVKYFSFVKASYSDGHIHVDQR